MPFLPSRHHWQFCSPGSRAWITVASSRVHMKWFLMVRLKLYTLGVILQSHLWGKNSICFIHFVCQKSLESLCTKKLAELVCASMPDCSLNGIAHLHFANFWQNKRGVIRIVIDKEENIACNECIFSTFVYFEAHVTYFITQLLKGVGTHDEAMMRPCSFQFPSSLPKPLHPTSWQFLWEL